MLALLLIYLSFTSFAPGVKLLTYVNIGIVAALLIYVIATRAYPRARAWLYLAPVGIATVANWREPVHVTAYAVPNDTQRLLTIAFYVLLFYALRRRYRRAAILKQLKVVTAFTFTYTSGAMLLHFIKYRATFVFQPDRYIVFHRNYAAAYFVLLLCFIPLFRRSWRRTALLLAGTACVLWTDSRGGTVALMVLWALMLYKAALKVFDDLPIKAFRDAAVVYSPFFLVGGAMALIAKRPHTVQVRLDIWADALKSFLSAKTFLCGAGPGKFFATSPLEANPAGYAHNMFLTVGVETGFPGLTALLNGLYRAMRRARHDWSKYFLSVFIILHLVDDAWLIWGVGALGAAACAALARGGKKAHA